MRNLSFKIIPSFELFESMSANLWRASQIYLGIYQEFPSLPVLRQPTEHSLKSMCSLESLKNTSTKVALLWEPLFSQ